MSTKLIALDAGHGLNTAGKRTPDGVREWTMNDKVRDKVVDILAGYDCEIIFPDHNEGSVDESLASRKNMYVVADVDAAVSIHHNAYSGEWNEKITGVETYVDRNNTAEDMRLAKCIQKRLPSYTGLKDRGVKKANWAVINQNSVPAVLVEGGFMDCTIDYKVITSDAGQTAYAKAVAEGLIEFLDLEKKDAPVVAPSTPSAPSVTSDLYKVQCGAFNSKDNALKLQTQLKKAGFDTFITMYGGMHKVQCGAFVNHDNAVKLCDSIKAKGFEAIIIWSGVVPTSPAEIVVGSTVRVNKGARTYEGQTLKSFVYSRDHKVYSIKGDKVVITYDGVVVAAIKKSDLTLVK